jgi:hypothetical protein
LRREGERKKVDGKIEKKFEVVRSWRLDLLHAIEVI